MSATTTSAAPSIAPSKGSSTAPRQSGVDEQPTRSRRWREDLMAAAPGWLVARVVVLAVLVLARFLVGHLHVSAHLAHVRSHQGLLAWDADWYRRISL
ncbi:MAG TPA: hypothetical protein VKI20_04240, partial [Acidimicrobiales bacterium]|nr:hypothetical protein [Acidimicrobiales bacterium]